MKCEVCLREGLLVGEAAAIDRCGHCLTVYNRSAGSAEANRRSRSADEALQSFGGFDGSEFRGGPLHRLLDRHVPDRGRLLDIGCFDGRFLAFAKELGFDGFGIEMQERMADFCRAQGLAVWPGRFPDSIPGDLASERFTVVAALESAYYWEGLDACAEMIHRLLAPNGYFLLKTNQSTSAFYNGDSSYIDRLGGFTVLPNSDAYRILFERHGLRLIACEPYAYVFDRRRHHARAALGLFFAGLGKCRALWARSFRPPARWDKIVMLFRKGGE